MLLLADGLREGGNFASWGIPTMDEFLMENNLHVGMDMLLISLDRQANNTTFRSQVFSSDTCKVAT